MSIKESEEFILRLYESMLRAQLNALKQVRKGLGFETKEEPKEKRTSQMDMVYDILIHTQSPMHIDDIILEIEKRFGIKADKDSLVSALTKRIKRQDRFMKTAPNTFALLTHEAEGGQR